MALPWHSSNDSSRMIMPGQTRTWPGCHGHGGPGPGRGCVSVTASDVQSGGTGTQVDAAAGPAARRSRRVTSRSSRRAAAESYPGPAGPMPHRSRGARAAGLGRPMSYCWAARTRTPSRRTRRAQARLSLTVSHGLRPLRGQPEPRPRSGRRLSPLAG